MDASAELSNENFEKKFLKRICVLKAEVKCLWAGKNKLKRLCNEHRIAPKKGKETMWISLQKPMSVIWELHLLYSLGCQLIVYKKPVSWILLVWLKLVAGKVVLKFLPLKKIWIFWAYMVATYSFSLRNFSRNNVTFFFENEQKFLKWLVLVEHRTNKWTKLS